MTLRVELLRYARQRPNDGQWPLFLNFLNAAPRAFGRDQAEGHFTGSAWLVGTDGEGVLLTCHRKFRRWLQLGGHADGDSDLARIALREAEEE